MTALTEYQLLGRKVKSVANTALLVTPIVAKPAPPVIEPLGSGLFMQIDDDYFLITAGHLLNLEDWKDLLVPGNNNQMVWLNGIVATTFNKPNLISNIDFAVLKFSSRQVKHLTNGHHGTIKPNHVLINHNLKYGDNYVIAGYPVSGVRKKYGQPIYKPIPLKLLTYPVHVKNYRKHGFNPNHHILLKYQRTLKPFNYQQKQITKEAVGISGSGLWFVPDWNRMTNGVPTFFLTGIMIENHKDKGFLAALRIDFVIETIRQIFNKGDLSITKVNVGETIKTLFCAEIP
ncbi:hypothetical protein ACFSUS_28375 [Spirosoma soli]|uniref:Trypsin-like peptidase domain-containing protein n=1 Tax=Spirosoma soli TaxID=1770529 RepID=A0ABW5MEQ8_9BACT